MLVLFARKSGDARLLSKRETQDNKKLDLGSSFMPSSNPMDILGEIVFDKDKLIIMLAPQDGEFKIIIKTIYYE